MNNSIRDDYIHYGVNEFYTNHADKYKNLHHDQVKQLLIDNQDNINYKSVFDLSCGDGLVTQILTEMGYKISGASDPYLFSQYTKNTGLPCYQWSFLDIIKNGFETNQHYSAIISSFSLHLCPPKQLYNLITQLLQVTDTIIIITPHKRPQLELLNLDLVLLDTKIAYNSNKKRIFLKIYSRN